MIQIEHLYISPGHNYFGHHGHPPDHHPMVEVAEVECVAGKGLRGDRFFEHKENYKGQVTFFSMEIYEELCRALDIQNKAPSAFRRNVLTRGVDLNELINREFEIQGIRFAGVCECSPCYWMDQAFGPGAEAALQGRGGLRARILTDGILKVEGAQSSGS